MRHVIVWYFFLISGLQPLCISNMNMVRFVSVLTSYTVHLPVWNYQDKINILPIMYEWEILGFNMDLAHPCGQNPTSIRLHSYLGVTLVTSHNFNPLENCLDRERYSFISFLAGSIRKSQVFLNKISFKRKTLILKGIWVVEIKHIPTCDCVSNPRIVVWSWPSLWEEDSGWFQYK